jgi:hypothetical protein
MDDALWCGVAGGIYRRGTAGMGGRQSEKGRRPRRIGEMRRGLMSMLSREQSTEHV